MKLSIIIPALNEVGQIGNLVRTLESFNASSSPMSPLEIIVSDGGSTDATRAIAREAGALVVEALPVAARNRGAQLQRGAAVATGEVLWFLHADARPHPQSLAAIRRTLRHPKVIGGNFRLKFASDLFVARTFEGIARLQRLNNVYYGDSGLFVRHRVFRELSGFKDWGLFEDYDLVRRLERLAKRRSQQTVCLPYPLIVSARRFEKRPFYTLGQWTLFQILFNVGVSPQTLADFYHK